MANDHRPHLHLGIQAGTDKHASVHNREIRFPESEKYKWQYLKKYILLPMGGMNSNFWKMIDRIFASNRWMCATANNWHSSRNECIFKSLGLSEKQTKITEQRWKPLYTLRQKSNASKTIYTQLLLWVPRSMLCSLCHYTLSDQEHDWILINTKLCRKVIKTMPSKCHL